MNLVDQPGQLLGAERLLQARGCAMLLNDVRRFCLVGVDQGNDRRRCRPIAQRFQNRETVKAGVDLYDSDIDIVQVELENFESSSRAICLFQIASGLSRSFRDDGAQTILKIRHQQGIPFHSTIRNTEARSVSSIVAKIASAIAKNNQRLFLQPEKTGSSMATRDQRLSNTPLLEAIIEAVAGEVDPLPVSAHNNLIFREIPGSRLGRYGCERNSQQRQ